MNIRYTFYLIVVGGYILFGLIGSWVDIWPWGALIIGVCIAAAEIGTYFSTRNK